MSGFGRPRTPFESMRLALQDAIFILTQRDLAESDRENADARIATLEEMREKLPREERLKSASRHLFGLKPGREGGPTALRVRAVMAEFRRAAAERLFLKRPGETFDSIERELMDALKHRRPDGSVGREQNVTERNRQV